MPQASLIVYIIFMADLIYKKESYQIIGAAMEVHRQLGNGFLEAVYQEALAIEFELRDIPFVREDKLEIKYKNRLLSTFYIADFVCYDKIIVEVKALGELTGNHISQVINYLNATGMKLGVLINFGSESLEYRRLLH